jgi:hypothetical protein
MTATGPSQNNFTSPDKMKGEHRGPATPLAIEKFDDFPHTQLARKLRSISLGKIFPLLGSRVITPLLQCARNRPSSAKPPPPALLMVEIIQILG